MLAITAARRQRAQVTPAGARRFGVATIGVATERSLGDQIMREIRRDPDYLDDPVLLEYVQAIWQPLLAAARARGEIGAEPTSGSPGSCSSCATAASTPSRCRAAMSACTSG